MKKYIVNLEGEHYEVIIESVLDVDGAEVSDASYTNFSKRKSRPLPPVAPKRAVQSAPVKTAQSSNNTSSVAGEVQAPIPGTVVSVPVKAGDQIKAGMVVAILEAMKMENEVTAQTDGVVKEVLVEAGQSVKTGEVLCVIE